MKNAKGCFGSDVVARSIGCSEREATLFSKYSKASKLVVC